MEQCDEDPAQTQNLFSLDDRVRCLRRVGNRSIYLGLYAANGSVGYTYDALGRVTTASYDTGVCILYSYDPNGNRLSETINVTTAGTTGVWGCFNWNASGGAKWGP